MKKIFRFPQYSTFNKWKRLIWKNYQRFKPIKSTFTKFSQKALHTKTKDGKTTCMRTHQIFLPNSMPSQSHFTIHSRYENSCRVFELLTHIFLINNAGCDFLVSCWSIWNAPDTLYSLCLSFFYSHKWNNEKQRKCTIHSENFFYTILQNNIINIVHGNERVQVYIL